MKKETKKKADKSRLVPIRLTPRQHEALRARALAAGLSMQKVMETLAESYLCDKIKVSTSAR